MADSSTGLTIGRWIAHHSSLARMDLEIALAHVLNCSRAFLLSHPEQEISDSNLQRLEDWASQLAKHVPTAYLCGTQEFWGLSLAVDSRVLVPRPDTETLVEQALICLASREAEPTHQPGLQILDLGTGSGAIALAIASERPDIQVHASDYSQDSLAVALGNSKALDLPIVFHHSNWFQNLNETYDVIAANPPYVDAKDPHMALLGAEPSHALIADNNGLADLDHISANAAAYLREQGWLLLEHGYDQGAAVRALMLDNGFIDVETRRDLGGNERVTWGQKAPVQANSFYE